jgi:hypothetical protein
MSKPSESIWIVWFVGDEELVTNTQNKMAWLETCNESMYQCNYSDYHPQNITPNSKFKHLTSHFKISTTSYMPMRCHGTITDNIKITTQKYFSSTTSHLMSLSVRYLLKKTKAVIFLPMPILPPTTTLLPHLSTLFNAKALVTFV